MKKKIVVAAAILCFIFTSAWALPPGSCYRHYDNGDRFYGDTINQGGAGGLGGAGGSASSVAYGIGGSAQTGPVTQEQSLVVESQDGIGKNKLEAKRELAAIPTSGGPADARFREDPRMIADWRVFEVNSIISRVPVWQYEEAKKLSANLNLAKQHKNLMRIMNKQTAIVEYVQVPPQPKDTNDMVIFLGWIPMSPDLKRGGLIAWLSDEGANDLTAFNLVGNQVVAAANAGATHLVPIKEGFIRGGHSEVDFLGIAGGGSSVFESGTKRAGGVSGSIGPSTTTMDAWDMDRPFIVAEAWCRLSDVERLPQVDVEGLKRAEAEKQKAKEDAERKAREEAERKAKINELQKQLDELKKSQ